MAIGTVGAPSLAVGEAPLGHAPSAWESKRLDEAAVASFADAYKAFLSANKTEREVAAFAVAEAKQRGFSDLLSAKPGSVKPGSKWYVTVHGKLAAFVVVGTDRLDDGAHLIAAHIDAVRIDLKQRPIYADANLGMLETHYYGGIKPYQWLSIPLELRGVVVKRGGAAVNVKIGADANDPVLVIPDVAVHMARRVDAVEGEEVPAEKLDPIVSSRPANKAKKYADRFAAFASEVISKRLGVAVGDLASAELALVPAGVARDVGLDGALIGGYGHDDRACTYAALRALFDTPAPRRTAIVMLVDKEEIGSTGNTGARSSFVRRLAAELLEGQSGKAAGEISIDRFLSHSLVLSADVTGGMNPHYPDLYDAKNAAVIGGGLVWDQSGVHAHVMAFVKGVFDDAGVANQPADWGKATGSKGEGGTVLPFFTAHGMDGIMVGLPVLSMHAPFELLSKVDLYEGFRGYRAFFAAPGRAR